MTWADALLLFGAGFLSGMLNTVAGGGTFISFPALVFIGVPEVAANASATFAAMPGYLSGAIGFRREVLAFDRPVLLRLTGWVLAGAVLGAGLLIVSSNEIFRIIVPFLLLIATVVFLWGDRVRDFAARRASNVTPFGVGALLPVAIYGGFFNGGLGIVLLALFSLWGMTNLHLMNGLKTWLSFAVSVIAAVVLAAGGLIWWGPSLVMMVGNTAGGYLGAPLARRLPMGVLRALIAAVGFGMCALFFYRLL